MKEKEKIVSFDGYKNKKEKQKNEFKKGLSVVVKQPKEGQEVKIQQIRDFKREEDKENRIKERNGRLALIGILASAIGGATILGIAGCESKEEQSKKEQAKYIQKLVENSMEKEEISTEDIIKQVINQMETKEEVKSFMDNLYIELYEQETGDTDLTTEYIEIEDDRSCQNLAYLDQETNEMILHGGEPYTVEAKLEDEGVSYTTINDVDAYRVRKDGKIIDTMAYNSGEYYIAKEGLQYDQYDENYVSILQKMGRVIPAGLEYARKIESTKLSDNDRRLLKNEFIDSLQEFIENENEVEIENLTAKEPAIEEDDLEL